MTGAGETHDAKHAREIQKLLSCPLLRPYIAGAIALAGTGDEAFAWLEAMGQDREAASLINYRWIVRRVRECSSDTTAAQVLEVMLQDYLKPPVDSGRLLSEEGEEIQDGEEAGGFFMPGK